MNKINSHSVHPLNRYIGQVLPSLSNENISPPTRTRITRACDHCQLRKTKCDSMKPRCSQCIKRNDSCTFTTRVCKRGPKPKRYSYLYPGNREAQVTKSTNVCPYPSILSTSNSLQYRGYNGNNSNSINIMNCDDFHRSRYSSLHKVLSQKYNNNNNGGIYNNLSPASGYYIPLHNQEFQKLPPAQLSQSSPPQLQSSENYICESLILPSLSRCKLDRLPSISDLLRGESDAKLMSYSRPTTPTNQNSMEIILRGQYKPVNNAPYYSHNNKLRNAYLREL